MTRWSEEQVLAVAPDNQSIAAGRRLAVPGPWSETGANETLVWGSCQGSGRTPYQVSVDVDAPAYRCTCPSRKFPCKHALALLLLWARGHVGDAASMADFAEKWAAGRSARSVTAGARPVRPVDADAQARRQEDRLARMDAGIEDFALWLADLARGGLAAARAQPYGYWDRAAARLVDAQLPGLADRVRSMAGESLSRPDWADHMLRRVGRWWLLVQAWRRREHLAEDDLADLRSTLGMGTPTAQVREGRTRTAEWQVLGAHRSEDGPLQQQRTWLRADDGELGLLLETAGPGQALGVPQLAGARLTATLAFYPGNAPRRVLFADQPRPGTPATDLGTGLTIAEALRATGASLAAAPWRARHPVTLRGIRIQPDPAGAVDADGAGLPLVADAPVELLLALTGSRPVDAFGEVEDGRLRILTLAVDETMVAV